MASSRDLFAKLETELEQQPIRKKGATADSYTAADIEVLEGLEPVRRRPGMYIGGTDEKALHHLFAEVIDNAMDEAVAGHADWIDVELSADGFLAVTDNGRGIPIDPHPKVQAEVGARSHHDHAALGRQVRQQGLQHVRRPARRRRLGRERPLGCARDRGRQGPAALQADLFARQADLEAPGYGRDQEPARHQGALPSRSADLRRARALETGATPQDGALEGLSVRRRRDPLALRARADQGRYTGRGRVPFSGRAQGFPDRSHRRADDRSRKTSSPARSSARAGTARSNGR